MTESTNESTVGKPLTEYEVRTLRYFFEDSDAFLCSQEALIFLTAKKYKNFKGQPQENKYFVPSKAIEPTLDSLTWEGLITRVKEEEGNKVYWTITPKGVKVLSQTVNLSPDKITQHAGLFGNYIRVAFTNDEFSVMAGPQRFIRTSDESKRHRTIAETGARAPAAFGTDATNAAPSWQQVVLPPAPIASPVENVQVPQNPVTNGAYSPQEEQKTSTAAPPTEAERMNMLLFLERSSAKSALLSDLQEQISQPGHDLYVDRTRVLRVLFALDDAGLISKGRGRNGVKGRDESLWIIQDTGRQAIMAAGHKLIVPNTIDMEKFVIDPTKPRDSNGRGGTRRSNGRE